MKDECGCSQREKNVIFVYSRAGCLVLAASVGNAADLHLCGCTVYINTYIDTGPIWSPATVRPTGLAAYIGRWLHCREIHLSGLLLLHFTVTAVDRLHCMLVMCGLMWTESDVTFLQRYCSYIRPLSLQPTC